jgi:outer membrane protein TolC
MQIADRNPLFDETKRIPHSSVAMKWFGFFLLAVASGFSGLAQSTNTSTVDTNVPNAPDLVYEQVTNASPADTNAPVISRELSLEDCIQLTLQHNLELQIDRYGPATALFALKSVYGAYDPLASFSGQHQHTENGASFLGTNIIGGAKTDMDSFNASVNGLLPWGTTYRLTGNSSQTIQNLFGNVSDNANAQASVEITQPLLKNFWIDSTRLAIRVDKNRLKYSQLQLKLQIMQTITALEKAYYDLIYDRENVVVQQMAAAGTDRLVAESKKKLELGALAELDLAQARAQAAQNQAAIITAESQLGTQERVLKLYLTEDITKWADVSPVPTEKLTAERQAFDRQNSWKKALSQRPEYLQAKLDVERQGIQLKFDWNQMFPQLNVFGTFGYNGSAPVYSGALYDIQQQNLPFYIFGGQISFPLGNIGARNTYKLDKVTAQQLVLTVKQVERNILISIDNDIGTLLSDYNSVQATHAQRLYYEQALDAEEKRLANGKSTTYLVILAQRDLTTGRGAEIQALDTYNKDLAQLSLDEGSTLDRLNIELNVK